MKVGRNAKCPCGSGRKSKKCCLNPTKEDLLSLSPDRSRLLRAFTDDGFRRLVGITIYLIQNLGSVAGAHPDDRSHLDFESLLKKSWYSLNTVGGLRKAHKVEGDAYAQQFSIFDHTSATALARIMYESAISLRYIFCAPDHLFTFRYSAWRLRGHLERRKQFSRSGRGDSTKPLKARFPDRDAINEKLAAEYLQKLKSSAFYATLPSQKQRLAEKGEWRLEPDFDKAVPWSAMAKKVGMIEYYGELGYSYGSSYVHSDAISAIQVAELHTPEQQLEQVYTALLHAITYHAHAMQSFFMRYPIIKEEPSHAKAAKQVDWWFSTLNASLTNSDAGT